MPLFGLGGSADFAATFDKNSLLFGLDCRGDTGGIAVGILKILSSLDGGCADFGLDMGILAGLLAWSSVNHDWSNRYLELKERKNYH